MTCKQTNGVTVLGDLTKSTQGNVRVEVWKRHTF